MKPLSRAVALAAALSVTGLAQSSYRPGTVRVPAVVTDRNYHSLLNLQQNQFALKVDHAAMAMRGFTEDAGPTSTVIVLDTNKGMKSVLSRSQEALTAFLKMARPGDEYALVLCRKGGPQTIGFSSDTKLLAEAFVAASAQGYSHLYDSLNAAFDLARQGKQPRRAIVVISDGFDTGSSTKFEDLRTKAQDLSVPLYALQFWIGHSYDPGDSQPLADLVAASGGVFFDDVSPAGFAKYFGAADVHERYLLSFQAGSAQHKRHQVEVRLKGTLSNEKIFWKHAYSD